MEDNTPSPICLLSSAGKLYERTVAEKLVKYMKENQYGLRKEKTQ